MNTPLTRRPDVNGASAEAIPAGPPAAGTADGYPLPVTWRGIGAHTSGRLAAQEHVMSLSHHQQHHLYRIETGLLQSDPQLTAMLGIFSRLSAGEAMPAREQVLTRRQSIRQAAALTVEATTVVAEAIGLLLRAVLALVIAVGGSRHGHRRPAAGPERTRRGREAGGRPDPAGQS